MTLGKLLAGFVNVDWPNARLRPEGHGVNHPVQIGDAPTQSASGPAGAVPSDLHDTLVSNVCFDSRTLTSGCVFVAVRGSRNDGHNYLSDAVRRGAIALVVEDVAAIPADYQGAVVLTDNSRLALNQIAAAMYGWASRELFAIGVTGTNGKTTTTHMIEAVFNLAGRPTGIVGTIDHHVTTPVGTRVWPTELTTPDPMQFQHRLREFVDLGARAVALEVSSIGLEQNRVDEVEFDVAIFTNLTRDHLDYHGDMERYFSAKAILFETLLSRSHKPKPTAMINADDPYGIRLCDRLAAVGSSSQPAVWRYGLAGASNQDQNQDQKSSGQRLEIEFTVLAQGFFGSRFRLSTPMGNQEFSVRMPGLHNVYNAAAAVGAALTADIDLSTCAEALRRFGGVKGRLEPVTNSRGLHIFVDYAHTDDAIATVLHYLGKIRREAGLRNRMILVFGCGGDRDRGKRPLMMRAALAGSDLVVVTSDNPRTENPQAIISDILADVPIDLMNSKVHVVVDRKEGIRKALALAQDGDVIVVAGKGHEDYQIIGTNKFSFSDVDVIKELLK